MHMLFAKACELTEVCEAHLSVAVRDVHCKRDILVLGQKAKRNVEMNCPVNFDKLSEADRKEFEGGMENEVKYFTNNSAVEICERASVPREQIFGMRLVLLRGNRSWMKTENKQAAKQRPGFFERTHGPRVAVRASGSGRNTIFADRGQFKVNIGDIKTAF